MPNSFTVVPNILPGNVTIGGNLTVSGDQLRIGAAAPFVRVGKDSGANLILSQNVGFDNVTLDSAGVAAVIEQLSTTANKELIRRINAAGTIQDKALPEAIFTDYTTHNHTGTTTEDTIYSKVIPANTLGPNGGLLIHVALNATVQGGVQAAIRFRLGGNLLNSNFIVSTAVAYWLDFYMTNAGAANSQISDGRILQMSAGTLAANRGVSAVDTTVDQTLTVTIQNGTSTDAQTFDRIVVQQLNSFGPV